MAVPVKLRLGERAARRHALISLRTFTLAPATGGSSKGRGPGHRPALCIVPVDIQHRDRLLLPFAAADPCIAEVMFELLLRTLDDEILELRIVC